MYSDQAMPPYTKRSMDTADLTISSKRQVTIPAAMARELGLEPGGKLVARLKDGEIVLKPRPTGLLEYLATFPKGTYGRTKEEIDAYVRGEREGWSRRARIAEGDSFVPEHDADSDG